MLFIAAFSLVSALAVSAVDINIDVGQGGNVSLPGSRRMIC
jgi:hypothetical protein